MLLWFLNGDGSQLMEFGTQRYGVFELFAAQPEIEGFTWYSVTLGPRPPAAGYSILLHIHYYEADLGVLSTWPREMTRSLTLAVACSFASSASFASFASCSAVFLLIAWALSFSSVA